MRKQCDSFSLRPIWSLLAENNYQSLVMESGAKKNSITKVLSCQEEERTPWLDDTVLLKIERAPGHKDLRFFHAKEKTTYELGRPYYDKACSARGCYNPLSVNFVAAYEKFFASKSKAFFLLRDFSFQKYLQRGELLKAKDVLMEIDKIIGYLNEQSQGQADFLILVTSAATLPVEYPLQGNNWATLEQKGIGLLYKKQALMSPLFVFGARAENFCGVYEDAQIIERLNKDSKKKGIEITIRNPFK